MNLRLRLIPFLMLLVLTAVSNATSCGRSSDCVSNNALFTQCCFGSCVNETWTCCSSSEPACPNDMICSEHSCILPVEDEDTSQALMFAVWSFSGLVAAGIILAVIHHFRKDKSLLEDGTSTGKGSCGKEMTITAQSEQAFTYRAPSCRANFEKHRAGHVERSWRGAYHTIRQANSIRQEQNQSAVKDESRLLAHNGDSIVKSDVSDQPSSASETTSETSLPTASQFVNLSKPKPSFKEVPVSTPQKDVEQLLAIKVSPRRDRSAWGQSLPSFNRPDAEEKV